MLCTAAAEAIGKLKVADGDKDGKDGKEAAGGAAAGEKDGKGDKAADAAGGDGDKKAAAEDA